MPPESLPHLVAQYDALLLDSDGTIGTTETVHAEIGARLMCQHGVPTSFETRFKMKGWGEARIWDEMAKAGTPIQIERADFINAQTEAFVAYIDSIRDPHTIRRKGMLPLVTAFKEAGKPIYIVSNTPTEAVEALKRATALAELIDHTISYTDIARMGLNKKPAPDAYDHAIRHTGIADGRFLIVEDSITGVTAGLAATAGNCDVFQIYYGSVGEKPHKDVHYSVCDTGDLMDIFTRHTSVIPIPRRTNDTHHQNALAAHRHGPAYDF